MREILFRGKRVDNGKWMYGDLLTKGIDFDYAIRVHGANELESSDIAVIDPETVGQFTGLTDKNGKMIFEGDIVAFNDTMHKVVFEQRCDSAYFGIVMGDNETWVLGGSVQGYMLEVVGNIHDSEEANI